MASLRPLCAGVVLALAGCAREAPRAPAPPSADTELASYIAGIKAVDNHAHPMRPVARGAKPDTEYDALPLDGIPTFSLPWRLTLDNPEWIGTARALYGGGGTDTGAALKEALRGTRERVIETQGEKFPEWVLDQTGIEVMFANRIVLGLNPQRFKWVPYDDALMFPLDTKIEAARSPDTRSLYPREAALLKRYMKDLGVSAIPRTLDDYVRRVVIPTLSSQHTAGAVAIKFEAAYLRALDFDRPDSAFAARVYRLHVGSRTPPTRAEYKAVEDYLFHLMARNAGRLGLAVHIHVLDAFGGFYNVKGATPLTLEPTFNDSTLRGTTFVLIHGGWPHTDETEGLLQKPNVYADLSMMDQIAEPAELAHVLRRWLSRSPEKVLFGTDAFDGGTDQGWGDVAAFATTSARKALTIALAGMVRDQEITMDRAKELARMVLRENANRVYHLGLK
ncbi:MAG TPA: amidohydrolase family protein [Gemmatimonadales bacterium]